jgi:hypothetical protein
MNQIVSEKRYIQERLGIPYENLSQSYLRAETQLAASSQYSFLLQRGQTTNPLVTERLLQLNDQFVISHFTLGLKFIGSTTPTDEQHLLADVHTFANPEIFTGNTSNAAALYNASFSWTIDRKQYLPNFPIRAFRRVPTAQYNVGAATGVTGTQADGYDNGLYGFFPSEPTLIDGRQTLDLVADLSASVNCVQASTSVYAVLEVRGYLVVNAKS